MWYVVAVLCATISLITMLLIARKWNLHYRAALPAAFIVAVAVSVPFLWIYRSNPSFWTMVMGALGQIGFSLAVALSLVMFRFWRDPERVPPEEHGTIVSPADGEVIFVRSIPGKSTPIVSKDGRSYSLSELAGVDLAECNMFMIGIEMNILNVHVNRCPIGGKVQLVKSIEGRFLSLRKAEAPFVNARCTTLIGNDAMMVATVQIASRLVRRVDSYLQPNQAVTLGQRLGMIRFGSQVTVIFPDREGIQIQVRPGQAVQAGTSIMARYL